MTDQYEGNEDVRPEFDQPADETGSGTDYDVVPADETDDDGDNTPIADPDDDTSIVPTPDEDATEDPDDDIDDDEPGVG